MIGVHHHAVLPDSEASGLVIPVMPGCERQAIERVHTLVALMAIEKGRDDDRPEMLGFFIRDGKIEAVMPDGTREPFLARLLIEYGKTPQAMETGDGKNTG